MSVTRSHSRTRAVAIASLAALALAACGGDDSPVIRGHHGQHRGTHLGTRRRR